VFTKLTPFTLKPACKRITDALAKLEVAFAEVVGQICAVLIVIVIESFAVAPAGVIVTPEICALAPIGNNRKHHSNSLLICNCCIIWLKIR
jgi:hypothetical protein